MVSVFSKNWRYFRLPLLFLPIFLFIAFLNIENTISTENKHFKNHATIIADDIWALNQDGARTYLQLAIKTQHYKSLSIAIPGNEEFLQVYSPSLTGLTGFLRNFKLIGLRSLREPILHEHQLIGTLHGEQYIRVIFPLLNILVLLLLVLLTGVFITYLFINRRILEQQVLERTQNLEESERRFHDLVNLLPEMVLETDLNGTIIYANKEAKIRFNLSSKPTASVSFFDLLSEETREDTKKYFKLSLTSENTNLKEVIALDPEKGPFPILIRSAPRQKNKRITGARTIAIDITDRHRMEEQLRRDQKMKAIGLMAGGVAHDLNNILSGIVSYPELLLLDMKKDNRLRHPLKMIRKAGLDASDVVSDLLTVARGIAAKLEIIAPNDLIKGYLDTPDFSQLKARYPLVSFKVSFDPDLRNISCSPIHIRKCLMNLITNGVEAISGKGQLSISTKNHQLTDLDPENKENLPTGPYIKILIHDSGSGIAPHEAERIFEPFYTTKIMGRSGTGLGLAVVWNTMRDHGGTVTVKSNEHGTTFELYFPSSQEITVPPPAEKDDWQNYKGHGKTVLVVDDETRQLEIATSLLQALGYDSHTVPSGEKAIKYLKNNSVDILVLDMIMSPGINGRETYTKILQTHPQQKAIIASGYAEDEDVRATMAMGAGAFIAKPYTLTQLGSAILNTLQE